MTNRALLYTTGSPYSRGVRIVLDELGLEYDKREELTTPSAESRARSSPTLQVPVFWDGEVQLWESSLIVDYLLSEYKVDGVTFPPLAQSLARPDHWIRDRLVASSIHTLGTSGTTIWQMVVGGTTIKNSGYLAICAEQYSYLLEWLENQLTSGNEGFIPNVCSIQDIMLGCHLRFVQNRPTGIELNLDQYPKISGLLSRLDERSSFINNPILWWEPGVIGYEDDGYTPIYEAK